MTPKPAPPAPDPAAATPTAASVQPRIASELRFYHRIEEARNANTNVPLVVSFGAPWCGWCQKMHSQSFTDPRVTEFGEQYLWVKVNIDDQPEVAAQFRVRGIPHTVILDDSNQIVAARAGYLAPDALVRFLSGAANADSAAAPHAELLSQLATAKADELPAVVASIVQELARPERLGRQALLDALREQGSAVWPLLLEQMTDERLAVRAAGGSALRACTGAHLAFQPFAPLPQRQQQHAAWQNWVSVQSASSDRR